MCCCGAIIWGIDYGGDKLIWAGRGTSSSNSVSTLNSWFYYLGSCLITLTAQLPFGRGSSVVFAKSTLLWLYLSFYFSFCMAPLATWEGVGCF